MGTANKQKSMATCMELKAVPRVYSDMHRSFVGIFPAAMELKLTLAGLHWKIFIKMAARV